MKRILITYIIVVLVTTGLDAALQFLPIDYARWGATTLTYATLSLGALPRFLLTLLIFLHYRKLGTLQEKLHLRYVCYLLLMCVVWPLMGPCFPNNDHFSDASTLIYNIAITLVACDFCMRQPEKMRWIRFALCFLLALSAVGILFVPMPYNMFLTYPAILIWLYAVVSAIVDASRRKFSDRGWYYAAFILGSAACVLPAYLLETHSSQLDDQTNWSTGKLVR